MNCSIYTLYWESLAKWSSTNQANMLCVCIYVCVLHFTLILGINVITEYCFLLHFHILAGLILHYVWGVGAYELLLHHFCLKYSWVLFYFFIDFSLFFLFFCFWKVQLVSVWSERNKINVNKINWPSAWIWECVFIYFPVTNWWSVKGVSCLSHYVPWDLL